MYPDDVVSALHLDGLARDLANYGWDVEALPCNRGCRDETKRYSASERHNGVSYNRVWRPNFSQKSFFGRIANSAWMIIAWSLIALRPKDRRPDVVLIGTDPMFGLAAAIPIRLLRKDIKIAHWCFDLHPEAAFESGKQRESSFVAKVAKRVMRSAYRCCDLIADIGPCMRRRLRMYNHSAKELELTPWALKEPSEPLGVHESTRVELFGDAKLGLLYSGNFGEAHTFETLLALARELRGNQDVRFCFAVRGNRAEQLSAAVTAEDSNISFAGFAPIADLEKRLGAADIHLATLKPEWAGIAVPSKFFGSLSVGRPVLYSGPSNSAIAHWISKYKLGWVVGETTIQSIAEEIESLISNKADLAEIQRRCHTTYLELFSQATVTRLWAQHLRALL